MKFPSHLNCDGKIVSEMGPRSLHILVFRKPEMVRVAEIHLEENKDPLLLHKLYHCFYGPFY